MNQEDAAKNRFNVLAILITAGLTTLGTWLVANYTMSHQLHNALAERQYATTQDLTNFFRQQEFLSTAWLRQQDFQYTNWLRQQDIQFTFWSKQQGVLDAKHEAELQHERTNWMAREDTLFEERLKELRTGQSLSHDYWQKQQQLLYYKDRSEQQAAKIKELVDGYADLIDICNRARMTRIHILASCGGEEPSSAIWPTRKYFQAVEAAKGHKELSDLSIAFKNQQFKLMHYLNMIPFFFDPATSTRFTNTFEAVYAEPIVMIDSYTAWPATVQHIRAQKLTPQAQFDKLVEVIDKVEEQRSMTPLFRGFTNLFTGMALEQSQNRVFHIQPGSETNAIPGSPPSRNPGTRGVLP